MTAQINDAFFYKGEDYALAGISEGELFDPSLLDMEPTGASTACYRGYQAVFTIVDSHLVLGTLHVNLLKDGDYAQDMKGPTINGVEPRGRQEQYDGFNNHYVDLNYHLEYSGGLLVARDFIRELYVHMGFHPAWKYQQVVELVFKNGLLIKESDRSGQMAEIRERVLRAQDDDAPRGNPTKEEIQKFIERAFDRRYRF